MTDSRETVRRKQFRDHQTAAAADRTPAIRTSDRLPYDCPTCRRKRQTTANQPPTLCPTCILDTRTGAP